MVGCLKDDKKVTTYGWMSDLNAQHYLEADLNQINVTIYCKDSRQNFTAFNFIIMR
jgi:hypothetical protein